MGDAWRIEGERRVTFESAKQAIVEEIAQGASMARTPQSLDVIRLSELDSPFHIERINADSVEELRARDRRLEADRVAPDRPSKVCGRPKNCSTGFRIRSTCCMSSAIFATSIGPAAPRKPWPRRLARSRKRKGAGTTAVHLLDVADPVRSPTQSEIRAHDNIGIVDLQPATKLAAQYHAARVFARRRQLQSRRPAQCADHREGQRRARAKTSSLTIVDLKPGINQATFTATFDQLGINQISATVETEESGLAVDNVRLRHRRSPAEVADSLRRR